MFSVGIDWDFGNHWTSRRKVWIFRLRNRFHQIHWNPNHNWHQLNLHHFHTIHCRCLLLFRLWKIRDWWNRLD
jgi:hypothetical protein